ncbi:MAG: OmpH family outer membrane protein [Verrucomicrobia bacterium]|nr:OmpH family outer membrane protein [Verrucomicrobiota bacterium]
MKSLLRSLLAVALLGVASLSVQAQPAPKVFVIDLAKLYESHYKTEAHITKLRADEQKAQVELERLNKEGNGLVEQYKELVEKANNNPLASADAKAKAEQDARAKLEEIERKKQEIQDFRGNVERALQQQMGAFREQILEEISKTATEIATRKGATILIDKAGPTGIGISNFVYLDPAYDITDEVLAEVNKNRPAAPAAAAAPAATAAPAAPAAANEPAPTVTFPGAKKN